MPGLYKEGEKEKVGGPDPKGESKSVSAFAVIASPVTSPSHHSSDACAQSTAPCRPLRQPWWAALHTEYGFMAWKALHNCACILLHCRIDATL